MQQRAIDPLQMPDQLRLDAIAREPDRAAGKQGFGRQAHDRLEKSTAAACPSARSNRSPKPMRVGGAYHGGRHQPAAAQFEEGSLTEAMACAPSRIRHRVALRHPAA